MRNPINALPVLKWHLSCVFRSEIKWGSFGKSCSAAAHFRNLKFRQNYTNSKLANYWQRFIFWFVLWFIHPDKKDLFILTSVKLATCVWGEQFLHFSIKRRSNNICALPPVPAAKVIEPCVKSKSDFVTFVSLRKIPIWGVAVRPFWCFGSNEKQKSLHRNALMTKLKTFLNS